MKKTFLKFTNKEYVNKRLDKFLSDELKISRTKLNQFFENDLIFLNSKIAKKNSTLSLNDEITINELVNNEIKEEVIFEEWKEDLDIVHEEDDFIVVYKESGILTHTTNYENNKTLANKIYHHFLKNNIEIYDEKSRLGIVNRLDKDTSGLIIVAKNKLALEKLSELFKENKVIRKYFAIVLNNFKTNNKMLINKPIGYRRDSKLKLTTNEPKNPKEARTLIEYSEDINNQYSKIICSLQTGRTHQIRVHLQSINHPIYNDPIYNNKKHHSSYGQFLQNFYLEFINPFNEKNIKIEIDIDKEIKGFLTKNEI